MVYLHNTSIPLSDDLSPLLDSSLTIGGRKIENRVVFQPMEGCDGTADGHPGELTARRYRRFAAAGPGIIWLEATAVVPEARANPRQLYLCEKTADSFKYLLEDIKSICLKNHGFEPLVVIQLTHSGRYSRPGAEREPLIAYNNPGFEGESPIPAERVVTDDYLRGLEEKFGKVAALAERAGFDGADIKCCHGYLLNESLSAHTRAGAYGGNFENRTRLVRNCFASARAATNFILTTRMNVYDGFLYPYGFGVNETDGLTPDLTEAFALIDILIKNFGLELVNITAGNPYVNPNVNRPADTPANRGIEDPLAGVERILGLAKAVQERFPELCAVASGFAYLRHNSIAAAAGLVGSGAVKLAGFGRQAFAYPDFLNDIRGSGKISPEKCCVTCAKCSELMRTGPSAGCVVRDSEVYAALYRENVRG